MENVKPCPCGGTPTVSRSLRSGSCVWCPDCRTTLSKGSYGFDDEAGPVIEWVHGAEHLPPKCPFCKFPVTVYDASSPEPKAGCETGICALQGKVFTLKEWNSCRPEAWAFKRLLKRWKGNPLMMGAARALKRAIAQHERGRYG